MIDTLVKIEICKEILKKSGQSNNKRTVDAIAFALMENRYLLEFQNNEIVCFITWENPQYVDDKRKVFIENLWIDPRYRNGNYLIKIRSLLRGMFPNTKGIWFNRSKQEMVERK